MEDLTEDGVEVNEDRPRVGVLVDLRANFDVHVERVRDILEHDEEVSDGQPSEDGVGGAGHLTAGEDRDVDGVGGRADDADQESDVAVQPAVCLVEVAGAGQADAQRLIGHRAWGACSSCAQQPQAASCAWRRGRAGRREWAGRRGRADQMPESRRALHCSETR